MSTIGALTHLTTRACLDLCSSNILHVRNVTKMAEEIEADADQLYRGHHGILAALRGEMDGFH